MISSGTELRAALRPGESASSHAIRASSHPTKCIQHPSTCHLRIPGDHRSVRRGKATVTMTITATSVRAFCHVTGYHVLKWESSKTVTSLLPPPLRPPPPRLSPPYHQHLLRPHNTRDPSYTITITFMVCADNDIE